MNKNILHLNKFAEEEKTVKSSISFKRFVEFLRIKTTEEQGIRLEFYKYVLNKFETQSGSEKEFTLGEAGKYAELSELITSVVLPFMEDENEALLGLSSALSPHVFYSTNAFYNLMSSAFSDKGNKLVTGKRSSSQIHREIQYDFILKELYSITSPQKKEWIHGFINPATGLYQYYRLNIDSRFVELKMNYAFSDADCQLIKSHMACEEGYKRIEKIIPLDSFAASGFTIITLTDVTAREAVEQLGKVVVELNEENAAASYHEINVLLQTLMGSSNHRFGIMPFFTINERSAILYGNFPYSILVKVCWDAGVTKEELSTFINSFLEAPSTIIFDASLQTTDLPDAIRNALTSEGIAYYNIVPVYYNSRLVGILETASGNNTPAPNAIQVSNLQPALPYISQLLNLFVNRFEMSIEAIVKDKFTNIQPAVQWKFNEVAWHFFRSNQIEQKDIGLESIDFKDVYPLYGAVDIRNSTIERNKALRQDLQLQVKLLLEIFEMLEDNALHPEAGELHKKAEHWSHHLVHDIILEELHLDEFIKTEAHALLRSLSHLPQPISDKISFYWKMEDEQTGIIFQKRREMEEAIRLINNFLGEYFKECKEDLQKLYPNYFDTFRTDGIEYDIYIGQSIAPKLPFGIEHLQKIRLWQIESMAAIAKQTHTLLPAMRHHLLTTQLIFVHAHAIDITFRNDERRFDVEGSYNIRYHVIKKRIDKVLVLNTSERLTQPSKIAIVYSDERDVAEYEVCIRRLQDQNILNNDLEYLDLEELQGVAGLKALRVGVAGMG